MPDHVHLIFTPLVDEQTAGGLLSGPNHECNQRSLSPQDQPGSAPEWEGMADGIFRSLGALIGESRFEGAVPARESGAQVSSESLAGLSLDLAENLDASLRSADKRLGKLVFC
jgi:hypothetical protein